MFCHNLEGWEQVGGGKEVQEGGVICIPMALIRVDVWQKPTQYREATIIQLKINNFFKV